MAHKAAFGMLCEREKTQSGINTKHGRDAHKMRGRYVKAFTIFGILLASTIAYPNSYAESEVTLNLDKGVYFVGESVIVSGLVQPPSDIVPIVVQVLNPKNEACDSQQINVSDDGSFVAEPVKLAGRICSIVGTYTVAAFYGEQESSITFELHAHAAATQNTTERLQALLNMLIKARENIDNKIAEVQGKGIEIPADVMETYEEALAEVQETEDAVAANDAPAAKEHTKNALLSFRDVFKALVLLEDKPEVKVSVAEESDGLKKAEEVNELRQAITRAKEFKDRLANIAVTNNINITATSTLSDNFAGFDEAIQEAEDLVNDGKIDEAARALAKSRQILQDIQKSLMEQARAQRQLKAKEFVERMVSRIDEMIENAKAIGLSQDVIDALENAKTKLLAAKSVNEILSVAEEIKVEKDEFTEQKRKNFERAIEHLESRLHEAKLNAEQFGISDDVFDEIQELVDDAKEQWAAGETKSAMNMLEKAEKSLRQVSGTMERAKKLFGELDRLANAAEELREKAAGNQEALDAIDKAVALINNAKGTLMIAVSQDDLENAYGMSEQAKQLLERARHMIGSKITPKPGTVNDSNALKRRVQALEDKAERLKEIAEKQQNREAMGIIMESIDIINKAKQMISEEDYEQAKLLLNQADELLTKAERILRSGRGAGSKTNAPVNETQARAITQEIEMLEAVVADLKSKAGDNKEADEHINAAIEDLNDAKEMVKQGHLDKAKSKVNDAKEHLRTAKQFIDGKSSEEKESGNDRSG